MSLLLLFNAPASSGSATGTAFQSFVEAGMFLGIWQLDDYLTFTACIHDDTGAAADADAVPSYAIYENETATAIVSGNMAKLGAVDGFYTERLQLTATSGFEIGKCYAIRIAATVGAIPAAAAHVFQMGGAGLTAQETADAVNNLAPIGVAAVGSIGANLDSILNGLTGVGLIPLVYTVTEPGGVIPISGVTVELYTEEACLNCVRRGVTNSFGVITFWMSTAGTYWIKCAKDGYSFELDSETVAV